MLHMYSILACRSRTTTFHLSRTGLVSPLMAIPSSDFLPNSLDLQQIRGNLIVLVSRLLTQYIVHLRPLSKCIPDHILHKYSQEMAQKSEVVVLDVVMKNEAKHSDMNDISTTISIRAILVLRHVTTLFTISSAVSRRKPIFDKFSRFAKKSRQCYGLFSRRGPFRKSSFFHRFGRRFASIEVGRAVIRRREAFSIVGSRRKRPRTPVFEDSRYRSISKRARTTISTTGSHIYVFLSTLPLSIVIEAPF